MSGSERRAARGRRPARPGRPALGLRWRLLLAVGLVIVGALVGVGLAVRSGTVLEFRKYLAEEGHGEPADAAPQAERLALAHAASGWPGVERKMMEWGDRGGPDGVVLDADGQVLAVSDPHFRELLFEVNADLLQARRQRGGKEEAFVLRAPHAPLRSATGEHLGELWLFSLPGTEEGHHEELFLGAVGRRVVWAVLLAGGVALALTWLAARRFLTPVEELTDAARALAAGDLTRRVTAHGQDEVGRLASAFNSMAETIERDEQSRRRMVADTAHELRMPITNLRCQIEALQDGLQPTDAAALGSLHEETLHLQRLVEDLQVLALADAGRLSLSPEALDLETEATRAVRALPAAADLDLRIDLGGLPTVHADPLRLQQILANLLANATAHLPPGGGIEITGRRVGDHVEVRIADDGPGIAPEHLPHLFDRFYRTDPSRQRATGGSGLGLSIVRRLVEAQGGEVRIESASGEGTTAIFTLPVA